MAVLRRRKTLVLAFVCMVLFWLVWNYSPGEDAEASHLDPALVAEFKELQKEYANSEIAIKRLEKEIAQVGKKKTNQVIEQVERVDLDEKTVNQNFKKASNNQQPYSLMAIPAAGDVCRLSESEPAQTDIQMLNVIKTISYDDQDGGVWKQGFDIKYSGNEWTADKPLQVFVIPHSHDDPGWVKTFDEYYNIQVKHILSNMVKKLTEHKKMKFIYAEISFFSKWWDQQNEETKNTVKELINEGRFELVTGGWVMPDEAAAHYHAMLDQLIEGHAWIRENLGVNVKPQSAWSIDPFGHTSTMAYLLKQSGLQNMLIQRVHYSTKKYFAEQKNLEFNWRQVWDHKGDTDILCHMMPFYSYDVPHTCGPDPKICCQFDFRRLAGKIRCPWGVNPVKIDSNNVASRASLLLDQYKKKSQLYKSNVLLIPLGDDFRYDSIDEWDAQYNNYQKLFDHMNSDPNLHVQAQFGTLSDYFTALRKEAGSTTVPEQSSLPGYPVLSGDFFTYADRADHYWSGYFTSRPFYKHWDRHLETTLRSAEVLFTQAQVQAISQGDANFPISTLYNQLAESRQAMGLFQHHDGITGTAKTYVNKDYGNRLLRGWKNALEVIKASAQILLNEKYDHEAEMFDISEVKEQEGDLVSKKILLIKPGEKRKVVLYNSLPHDREEMVRLSISSVPVSVYDSDQSTTICQVSPFYEGKYHMSKKQYKLNFLAKVPALGLSTYIISGDDSSPCSISNVQFYNADETQIDRSNVFDVETRKDTEFSIHNGQLQAGLSTSTGMLTYITDKLTNSKSRTEMNFIYYKSSAGRDHAGGAYLFLPVGKSQAVEEKTAPLIRVVTGSLFHEVHSFTRDVQHVTRLVNTPGPESLAVEINNIDNIMAESNFELGMQIHTDIEDSSQSFFSDLNGFTMHKRTYQKKLTPQGNFYPMTSMAYMEGSGRRLSVLAAQSAGVASLQPGELQVMLDRRLNQDDSRGLGQSVQDNKLTASKFYIMIEQKHHMAKVQPDQPVGYPSMVANILHQHMINQITILHVTQTEPKARVYAPMAKSFPCEVHLVNLRSMADPADSQVKGQSLLIVHHQAADCTYPAKGLTCQSEGGQLNVNELWRHNSVKSMEFRSLTNVHTRATATTTHIQLDPMAIQTYSIEFK